MAKIGTALVVCALVASMVVAAESILTCSQTLGHLNKCIGYLKGKVGVASPNCCSRVRALRDAAKTTADRQAVCRCLKRAATTIRATGLIPRARSLPRVCRVNIPYDINPSIDCQRVK